MLERVCAPPLRSYDLFLLIDNQLFCFLFSVFHLPCHQNRHTPSTFTTTTRGDEEEEYVSNKEVCAMIKVMAELFTKNQHSTDTTLERVERSMARIIDRVDALGIGLP
jgi:hypothetical protein